MLDVFTLFFMLASALSINIAYWIIIYYITKK